MRRAKKDPLKNAEIVPVEAAIRLAVIFGANSAASRALLDLQRRLNAGEDAVILMADDMLLVGPRPARI